MLLRILHLHQLNHELNHQNQPCPQQQSCQNPDYHYSLQSNDVLTLMDVAVIVVERIVRIIIKLISMTTMQKWKQKRMRMTVNRQNKHPSERSKSCSIIQQGLQTSIILYKHCDHQTDKPLVTNLPAKACNSLAMTRAKYTLRLLNKT